MDSAKDNSVLKTALPVIGLSGSAESTIPSQCQQIPTAVAREIPIDILLAIFEEIIEEEVSKIREIFPLNLPQPLGESRVRLALVSRRWKDIVYDSPSLWRVLLLDFNSSLESVQIMFDRLISLAKGSAIDLFLKNIHNHDDDRFVDHQSCASDGDVFSSLHRISNLRGLSVHILWGTGRLPLGIDLLPSLANLRYFHLDSHRPVDDSITASSFLLLMPRLVELKLSCRNLVKVSEKLTQARFSNRCLLFFDIELYSTVTPRLFLSFLHYFPNVEYLCINGRVLTRLIPTSDAPATLYSLRTLRVKDSAALTHSFISSCIDAPYLTELLIDAHVHDSTLVWQTFFKRNPTITKLTIPVMTGCTKMLREAHTIQHLTLNASNVKEDNWLDLLVDLGLSPNGPDERSRICPALRTLVIDSRSPSLSASTIEPFMRSRCIPVDTKGHTVTGYKALESLTIRTSRDNEIYEGVMNTNTTIELLGYGEMEKKICGELVDFLSDGRIRT